MKSFHMILALGILALSAQAYASQNQFQFQFQPQQSSCTDSQLSDFLAQFGIKQKCQTVSVPEPATLGLLGIGLIGLAVKRRRK